MTKNSITSKEDAIPKARFDFVPLLLIAALALLALPLIGSPSTWATLTVAGLAMGLIIFIIASGLTLVFGLMDVLNFGHGVFIALGAFMATTVLGAMSGFTASPSLISNLIAVALACIVGMGAAAAVGLVFERVLVRPVYGMHLKQILITMGGMIIGEELIKLIWGAQMIPLPLPEALRPPQQHGHHQRDIAEQRQLGSEEAAVVGQQAHGQGADKATQGGTQAADDDDDEDQGVDLGTDLRRDALLIHAPHHPTQAGQSRAADEDANEETAYAIAQAFHHLAVLHTGADQQAQLGAIQ